MLVPIRTPFAHLAQYTVFASQTLDNLWFFFISPEYYSRPKCLFGEQTKCRVFSRNWPVRVKWAPFCNFRGYFFKKAGPRKGFPQKLFELISSDCSMRTRTFIELISYRLASTEREVKMTLMF